MDNTKYKEMERIIVSKDSIDYMEEDIIIRRGLERYMYVRQFVYGKVLDIASGVGYGSYILSKNPDTKVIIGIDKNEEAVNRAKDNFSNEKVSFYQGSPEEIDEEFDILVCMETIEHLSNPSILAEMVERCKFREIVISFPNKKTTHYNQYHLWDITEEDIHRLFKGYQCYKVKVMNDSTIMNLLKVERNRSEFKHYCFEREK